MSPDLQPSAQPQPAEPQVTPARRGWFRRIASVLFIVFCLELGLFLMIYPWTDSWSGNYFSWLAPQREQAIWHEFWNNSYLRGAVTGLGLVNIWLAIAEALHMYIGHD